MKKLISSLVFFFWLLISSAQSPNAIPYQAVVRNAAGLVVSNQSVKMRFSIRDSIAAGTVLYREQHAVTTNGQGLVSLNIGTGSVLSGTFTGINWGRNAKFLQAELDAQNNNNFTDLGTAQMMSVPYAFFAQKAANGQSEGIANGEMQYWNGNAWVRLTPGNYGQSLVICDGMPQWGGCLPKLTTAGISGIAQVSATGGGNITNDGGAAVTARGICWGTSPGPTLSNSRTINGSGTGSFTSNMTGLTANTTYYVRAYATNNAGTAYGNELSFTTSVIALATLSTNTVTSVTLTSAVCGGNITNAAGSTISMRGVCWSTSPNPTVALSTKTQDGSGAGNFTSNISGLQENVLYYVRAYATNSAGTAYGNEVSFRTVTVPSINTGGISATTYSSASTGGSVLSDGGATITARGVCWSTSPNPNTGLTTKTSDGTGSGNFESLITGILPNTTYYYRAYATNLAGTVYGNESTFRVQQNVQAQPVVDIDGNTYPTVTNCGQTWMQKNLNVSRYRNGDLIPQVTDVNTWKSLTTGAWCWYNNDSATYAAIYGKLYNYYAVIDPRGLAPAGWHVPDRVEFGYLLSCVGGIPNNLLQCCPRYDSIQTFLMSQSFWTCTSTPANPQWNISGFSLLPAGSLGDDLPQTGFAGSAGNFAWVYGRDGSSMVNYCNENASVNIYPFFFETNGYSVRCVKD